MSRLRRCEECRLEVSGICDGCERRAETRYEESLGWGVVLDDGHDFGVDPWSYDRGAGREWGEL